MELLALLLVMSILGNIILALEVKGLLKDVHYLRQSNSYLKEREQLRLKSISSFDEIDEVCEEAIFYKRNQADINRNK